MLGVVALSGVPSYTFLAGDRSCQFVHGMSPCFSPVVHKTTGFFLAWVENKSETVARVYLNSDTLPTIATEFNHDQAIHPTQRFLDRQGREKDTRPIS
jgi:hypothetical protein